MTVAQSGNQIITWPAPFPQLRDQFEVPPGCNITKALRHINIPVTTDCIIRVNSQVVPRRQWASKVLEPGEVLTVQAPVRGGDGGKDILRLVSIIAVAIIAPQFAPTVLVGGVNIGGAIVTIAGTLAVNALIPPSTPGLTGSSLDAGDSPVFAITGSRNQLNPYGVVPQALGRIRMYPLHAGQPYTELVGNIQYLRALFLFGYGPLVLEDLKIGETNLDQFQDIEYRVINGTFVGGNNLNNDDELLSIYTADVNQLNLDVLLAQSTGFVQRTSEPNTTELQLELVFKRGLVEIRDNGSKEFQTVEFQIEYSVAGSGTWVGSGATVGATTSLTVTDSDNTGGSTWIRVDNILLSRATGEVTVDHGNLIREKDNDPGPIGVARRRVRGVDPNFPEEDGYVGWPIRTVDSAVYFLLARVYHGWNHGWDTISTTDDIEDMRSTSISNDFDNTSLLNMGANTDASFEVTQQTVPDKTVKVAAGFVEHKHIIKDKITSVLRYGTKFKVASGQYDVRIKRVTADNTDLRINNESHWSVLRSFNHNIAPVNLDDMVLVEMRIKATDQLNGVIDNFNAVVTTVGKDYDTVSGTWNDDQLITNPAAIYRHILQGPANSNPMSDSEIDLDSLEDWYENCQTRAFTFGLVYDNKGTLFQRLSEVGAAGLGSFNIINGQFGIVQDIAQTVPIQHITPRNSFNFEGEKKYGNLPHALRVEFFDETGDLFERNERTTYDDTFDLSNATQFERMQFVGVTNPNQIYVLSRYHMGVIRLRPEVFSVEMDVENIVCTRGDLVKVVHDVPQFGTDSARLMSITSEEVAPDYINAVLDQLPVAYYRFNETSGSVVVDFSGDSLNGTYQNEEDIQFSEPGSITNDVDTAVCLNRPFDKTYVSSNGNWADMGNPSALQLTQNFTITFAIKVEAGETDTFAVWSKSNETSNLTGYDLIFNGGNGTMTFSVAGDSTPGTPVSISTTIDFRDGLWHWVACVHNFSSDTMFIYVDDPTTHDVTGSAAGESLENVSVNFLVGNITSPSVMIADMCIDELSIHNSVISVSGLQVLYNIWAGIYDEESVKYRFDETFELEEGVDYAIRLRASDGSSHLRQVIGPTGTVDTSELVLDSEISLAQVDDLVTLGINGQEAVDCLVKAIEPSADLSARLTLIPYGEGVLDSASGPIPPFDDQITNTRDRRIYDAPSIESIRVNASFTGDRYIYWIMAQVQSNDRNFGNFRPDAFQYQKRVTPEADAQNISGGQIGWSEAIRVQLFPASDLRFDTEFGVIYDIRVRTFNSVTGQISAWSNETGILVSPELPIPTDIDSMVISDGVLSWVYNDPPADFVGYRIRYMEGTGTIADWDTSNEVSSTIELTTTFDTNVLQLAPGTYTFMVKGETATGQQSEDPVIVVTTFGTLSNLVWYRIDAESIDESGDGFLGIKNKCTVVGGDLKAQLSAGSGNSQPLWSSDDPKLYWSGNDSNLFWRGTEADYEKMTYTTVNIDPPILTNGTGKMTLNLTTTGDNVIITYQKNAEGFLPWPGQLFVEDPDNYTIRVEIDAGVTRGTITDMSIDFRAKVIEEFIEDFIVASGGTVRLTYDTTFDHIIQVGDSSVQNDGNGGQAMLIQDKSATLGPSVTVVNSAGTRVTGLIDATIKGY